MGFPMLKVASIFAIIMKICKSDFSIVCVYTSDSLSDGKNVNTRTPFIAMLRPGQALKTEFRHDRIL